MPRSASLPWVEMPAFMKEISKHDELSYKAMQLTILKALRALVDASESAESDACHYWTT